MLWVVTPRAQTVEGERCPCEQPRVRAPTPRTPWRGRTRRTGGRSRRAARGHDRVGQADVAEAAAGVLGGVAGASTQSTSPGAIDFRSVNGGSKLPSPARLLQARRSITLYLGTGRGPLTVRSIARRAGAGAPDEAAGWSWHHCADRHGGPTACRSTTRGLLIDGVLQEMQRHGLLAFHIPRGALQAAPRSRRRATFATLSPGARATSASRSFAMICSAVSRFRAIPAPLATPILALDLEQFSGGRSLRSDSRRPSEATHEDGALWWRRVGTVTWPYPVQNSGPAPRGPTTPWCSPSGTLALRRQGEGPYLG